MGGSDKATSPKSTRNEVVTNSFLGAAEAGQQLSRSAWWVPTQIPPLLLGCSQAVRHRSLKPGYTGSIPVTPARHQYSQFSGRTSASQADHAGPIPVACSITSRDRPTVGQRSPTPLIWVQILASRPIHAGIVQRKRARRSGGRSGSKLIPALLQS